MHEPSDHAAIERDVLVGQRAQVAKHCRFRAVTGEGFVLQVVGGALLSSRNRIALGFDGDNSILDPERVEHGKDVVGGRGLVAGDTDMIGIDQTQVDPGFLGRSDDVGRLARNLSEHGVEERIVDYGHAAFAQAVCQRVCAGSDAQRDRLESLGAVVARVHRGEDGEEHLSGTDVGCRLLSANVLLTCLQREAVCLVSVGVDRDATKRPGS